jgi:hypothetical protein
MRSSLVFTAHARTMMHERGINEDWVKSTVRDPDLTEPREDDEVHYLKKIPQKKGKVLRVIINPTTKPDRVITVFFDRRVQL